MAFTLGAWTPGLNDLLRGIGPTGRSTGAVASGDVARPGLVMALTGFAVGVDPGVLNMWGRWLNGRPIIGLARPERVFLRALDPGAYLREDEDLVFWGETSGGREWPEG